MHGFGSYGAREEVRRHWGASFAVSSSIYLLLAAVVMVVGREKIAKVAKDAVNITFVEKIVKEPPPAPPPVAEGKPQAPAAAAPVVRPDQKIRRLDKPPPPKEMVAPKEMPNAKPEEADPSQDKGVAVYGDGNNGDAAGLEGGVTQGGVVGGQVGGAIALPDDADPPMPNSRNAIPEYPREARASGTTGMVVLKVVILADGSVGKVDVLRGEEPFVTAALKVIKGWKYSPARYKGQPIAVYRIIQIPFKLT